jgi:hypothetical protein
MPRRFSNVELDGAVLKARVLLREPSQVAAFDGDQGPGKAGVHQGLRASAPRPGCLTLNPSFSASRF